MSNLQSLTPDEQATYEWQMWVPGLGEEGQKKLKGSTVLVTRVGGLGGVAAYELAAAGVGKLILAHAGSIKPSDLNRQLLMTHADLGTSRVECASRRLRELNPRIEIEAVPENINDSNAARLVGKADVVVCCAPLFEERLLLNEQSTRQKRPMVDSAMYELTAQITTIIPGKTACLSCRIPEPPASWKRQFPVLGAVAGTVGCLGALEAIKLITGIGEPLANRLLMMDLRDMRMRSVQLAMRSDCAICGKR